MIVNSDLFEDIVADFQNGISISKLSVKYNMPYRMINNYLINNKYKVVKHHKISERLINEIIAAIRRGFSVKEIMKDFNVGFDIVKQIALENNLTLCDKSNPRSEKNQYFVDDYFSIIDTESKAYLLGLIYADGNVREHNGGYYLSMELKREDEYMLCFLASELKCNNLIYRRDRQTNMGDSHMSSFTSCNSKQLFDDLLKFGIVPNKSHNYDSFRNIKNIVPKNLIKHFLRGLIDGDGSISNRRKCRNQNVVAIYQNSLEFCNNFDSLLKYAMDDYSIFTSLIKNKQTGVYCLRYRRINDIKKILEFLYKDSTINLVRKYKLASLYFDNEYKIA